MNNKILGTSKRISASFLLHVFSCILNLKFWLKNFQSNLILPNDIFETFLFNKNIFHIFQVEAFHSTKLAYSNI